MLRRFTTRDLLQVSVIAIAAAAVPLPAFAQTQTYAFSAPARPLETALRAFARTTGQQVLFDGALVRGKRSPAISGRYSADQALGIMLRGSGLQANRGDRGAWVIQAAPGSLAESPGSDGLPAGEARVQSASAENRTPRDSEGVPEILVVGQREWSLNTGIERTRDDAQPFVVFDREEIRRSGSPNLDQFLRDFVTSNSQQYTADQVGLPSLNVGGRPREQGQSSIDLRGLGARDTLILVDGRRQPGINTGSGELEQADVTNIPLASIERIEVLASSASGIYGAGASGGVINIILRRDYSGGRISATYADTRDTKAPDKRIDLNYGLSLEGGRSNISVSASYRDADSLLREEREAYLTKALRSALRNNPNLFVNPPLGATPNVRRTGSALIPLTIDPGFGGGVLNPGFFFVPEGYRGLALDGIAPLRGTVGQYNFDFADSAGSTGGRAPILLGSKRLGGTVALRREMTPWLRVYAEAGGSQVKYINIRNLLTDTFSLAASAPNNPFQQTIVVTAPIPGYEQTLRSKNEQLRFVGGAIATLPYKWQAIVDGSYTINRFTRARNLERILQADLNKLVSGEYDILRDPEFYDFKLTRVPLFTPDNANKSTNRTVALKLAGPVPFELPGGEPTLVLNLEQNRDDISDAVAVSDDGSNFIQISVTPERRQTISSAYGEIRLPLIGDANNIPLVQGFEVTLAGRYEHYKGVGSGNAVQCFSSTTGLPTGEDIEDLIARTCDPSTLTVLLQNGTRVPLEPESTSNSHFDPSVSAKWTVSPDLTVRASYATGYLPPYLSLLIKRPGVFLVPATDPERGGEFIGTPVPGVPSGAVNGFVGGNPDVLPETSKTLSVGLILTPRFIPGLRFSADYTDLRKRNVYGDANQLLFDQESFETFLDFFPERITRGPASGGFAVGPITSIDASVINLAGYRAKAIDFALDYRVPYAGGRLDFGATATRNLLLEFQTLANVPPVNSNGVVPLASFPNPPFVSGNVKWKGNASVRYSDETATVGLRGRYQGGYFLFINRSVDVSSGTNRIRSQFYLDVFGSYRLGRGFTLQGGMNNLLNSSPPIVRSVYSSFGDIRGPNFYLTLSKDF